MTRRNLVKGLGTLVGMTAVLLVGATFYQSTVRQPTEWVLAWAGLESIVVFSLLYWALDRPVNVFYGIFVGGTLMRLASLMLVGLVLHAAGITPTVPLLTLVFSYFILSLLQIPFLGQTPWIL